MEGNLKFLEKFSDPYRPPYNVVQKFRTPPQATNFLFQTPPPCPLFTPNLSFQNLKIFKNLIQSYFLLLFSIYFTIITIIIITIIIIIYLFVYLFIYLCTKYDRRESVGKQNIGFAD